MSMIGGVSDGRFSGGGGYSGVPPADYFYKLMPVLFYKSGKEAVEQVLSKVLDHQYDSTIGTEVSAILL